MRRRRTFWDLTETLELSVHPFLTSCARSFCPAHTSQRVRAWRATTPTTAESCLLRSCHTSYRGLQREDVPTWPPALRWAFPQTFPGLLARTGAIWGLGHGWPKTQGVRSPQRRGKALERQHSRATLFGLALAVPPLPLVIAVPSPEPPPELLPSPAK